MLTRSISVQGFSQYGIHFFGGNENGNKSSSYVRVSFITGTSLGYGSSK